MFYIINIYLEIYIENNQYIYFLKYINTMNSYYVFLKC